MRNAKQVLSEMEKAKKVNNYKTDVLEVNAKLKEARPTFAGALKMLVVLMPESTDQKIQDLAKSALKDESKYNKLKDSCKPSKSGKYSPFGILQGIYRLNK